VQRQAYLAEFAALGKLQAEHQADPLVAMLIQAALLQTEANLKIAEAAEDQAEEMAAGIETTESASPPPSKEESRVPAGRLRQASGR